MAQIRGSWFSNLRAALERHGLLADIEPTLPSSTRHILAHADAATWFDEGHAVSIYESLLLTRGAEICREVGRDAARFAMVSAWREMMQAIEGLLGNTPRMAFEQLPLIWNSTRKGAGDLVCVESSAAAAATELTGFAYGESRAWVEVWAGHHEALLRHLRFAGHADIGETTPGVVRIVIRWGSALRGSPTLSGGENGS